jgi:hypothetical protein
MTILTLPARIKADPGLGGKSALGWAGRPRGVAILLGLGAQVGQGLTKGSGPQSPMTQSISRPLTRRRDVDAWIGSSANPC